MKKEAFLKGLPLGIFVLTLVPVLIFAIFATTSMSGEEIEAEEYPTANEYYQETLPVVSENNYITSPYVDSGVTIGKSYYDYKGEETTQENSIVVKENTYYQNTGIDYVKKEVFDVIAIADGTVKTVKEDDILGKIVEVEHKNGLISIYQSLSEVSVKQGDNVGQGQVIGKSGTNEMEKELGNHLHFEIYVNGSSVNPELYINKEYKKEN